MTRFLLRYDIMIFFELCNVVSDNFIEDLANLMSLEFLFDSFKFSEKFQILRFFTCTAFRL